MKRTLEQIQAEIAKLEQEAESVKQEERASALAEMKKLQKTYMFTKRELGLLFTADRRGKR